MTFQPFICHGCPYGSNCGTRLTAKVDFWGMVDETEVHFFRCPSKYCCTSVDCTTFDQCTGNRMGRLCGKCIEGYSEALFTSVCVEDSKCSDGWLIAIVILVGTLYAIFLLFQKDLKGYLISGPLGTKSFIKMKDTIVAFIKPSTANKHEEEQNETLPEKNESTFLQRNINLPMSSKARVI